MVTFFTSLEPGMQAALVGAAGTFATAVLALLGLRLQLLSQAKQSREAIAENERRKLKAAMYDDAVSVSRALSDAIIDFSTFLRTMAVQVGYAAEAGANGQPYPLPSARVPTLMALYDKFTEETLRFIFLVEERQFIDPRILVFRSAMNVVLHSTRQIMYFEFAQATMLGLPRESPNGETMPYTAPNPERAAIIISNCDRLQSSLGSASSYTEDFLVEMQNRLLGDLFGHKIQHRKPIDPDSKVIMLDRAQEMEEWINNSTDWGKHCALVIAQTQERFTPPGNEANPRAQG